MQAKFVAANHRAGAPAHSHERMAVRAGRLDPPALSLPS
jgi:hypothetical protein